MHITFKNPLPNTRHESVTDVKPEEVKALKEQLKLIDVRQPEEFTGNLGHIEGSQLIVLKDLPKHLSQLPTDKTIVFVCRSGNRSGQAAAYAHEYGIKHAYNMFGGMLLWNDLGYEISTESE